MLKTVKKTFRKNIFLYLLPIPGLILLLMFDYLPMAGLYIVFERYTYEGGLFGSEFVGLDNFRFFFQNMDNALRATRNTLIINVGGIVIGLFINVSLAIMLSEISSKRFLKITQSVMLFPYFMSWIMIGTIARAFLTTNGGLLNKLLELIGLEPVSWYMKPGPWWAIMIFVGVWKGMGYGSMVYFAALMGFDHSLYEAAEIDGASRFQRIIRITVPLLKPTIIIMFLLSIGGILGGSVDSIMGMTGLTGVLLKTTDTIGTFVYRSAMLGGNFESASAITLYQSIFGFLLVMFSNYLVKKAEPDYALF